MKIIQVLPCLDYADAVSNDTLAIDKILKKMGFETMIYAEAVDGRISPDIAREMEFWPSFAQEDVLIYHMAIGWEMIDFVKQARCRKIAIYHNITPAHFYRDYKYDAYISCRDGREQVKDLKDTFDYCLADSAYNRQELIEYGYTCPIDVLPIVLPLDDYQKQPMKKMAKKYGGQGHNILFVGRIVPNKKQEDVIAAFALYQKYYDPLARLFLVGSFSERDLYYIKLRRYLNQLQINNVFFSGRIPFQQILEYYSIADVFLCMSEHEGFCVPVVESMLFELPVVAYDACAVGDTMGQGGILFQEKNFLEVAALLDRVVKDQELRKKIIHNQKIRLQDFQYEAIEQQFITYLNQFLEKTQK